MINQTIPKSYLVLLLSKQVVKTMKVLESNGVTPPDAASLERNFHIKYGSTGELGWGPSTRKRYGYYNPDDYYETVIDDLLKEGQSWLDVGCGRRIFPSNPNLAELLAERSGYLAGVDPDNTIQENPFIDEGFQVLMDDFRSDRKFDLITMRMVAEHVVDPEKLMTAVCDCTRQGSYVIVYTINRWSPVPVVTHLAPFALHHPAKKVLWGSEQKDTFPTAYKMNTYKQLGKLFSRHGFDTAFFAYLDDCRTLARYKSLLNLELILQKITSSVGIVYPENCLLGVYRKR